MLVMNCIFYKKNPFQVHDCSNDGYLDPESTKKRKVICNNKGLTPAGEALVKHMMSKNIMIDIDHLSERSLDKVSCSQKPQISINNACYLKKMAY